MTKSFLKPEILFLICALFFGMLLIFVNPPMQAPDEDYHFQRAYSAAHGHILALKSGKESGDFLPCALQDFSDSFLHLRSVYFSGRKTSLEKIKNSTTIEINNKNKCFFNQQQQALYSPAAYIPQSAGILVSKIFTNSVYWLFIGSRIFMLLFYTVLGYFSIKSAPFLKQIVFLILLMPMSLLLGSSASADGVLIALSVLYFAKILKYSYSDSQMNKKQFFFLMLLAFTLSLVKQSLLLTFFILFIPKSKFENIFETKFLKPYPVKISILLFPAVLATLIWSKLISAVFVPLNGANPAQQIDFILNNPANFLNSLHRTILVDFQLTINSMIGSLGWFLFPLDRYVYTMYIFVFFSNIIILPKGTTVQKSALGQNLLLILLFLTYCFLICLILYLSWVKPGQTGYWSGLQGRYFIPVIFPFAVSIFLLTNKYFSRRNASWLPVLNILLLIIAYQNVFYKILTEFF